MDYTRKRTRSEDSITFKVTPHIEVALAHGGRSEASVEAEVLKAAEAAAKQQNVSGIDSAWLNPYLKASLQRLRKRQRVRLEGGMYALCEEAKSFKVLVKVGAGEDSLFPVPEQTPLADMDRMALLEALAGSNRFCNKLKDVALDDCKVFVLRHVAGEEPTAAEEADTIELRGARTIGEALQAAGRGGELAGYVFIRVRVPGPAPRAGEHPDAAAADLAAPFQRLYDALLAAQPEPIPGGKSGASIMRLPDGVEWPQLGAAPLFVRAFYAGCVDGPLCGLDRGLTAKLRKLAIIGNAGIGKSAFGMYVLWCAVQARRTVIYLSDKVDDSFIFHSDGRVEVFAPADFDTRTRALRHLASTVLIIDGIKPPVCAAFTVLITSPKRERYKEYLTVGDACPLYFPVLTRAEMSDMRATCFPDVEEAGVWERYAKWGGIPRHVLQKLLFPFQDELECAVWSPNLDRVRDALFDSIKSDDPAANRLFHLKPKGETADGFDNPTLLCSYFLGRTELGSPYIVDAVVAALRATATSRLHELLDGALAANNSSISKLYGDVYGRVALDVLCEGGSFPCFNVTKGERAADLMVPACDRVVFNGAADLRGIAAARSKGQLGQALFVPSAGTHKGLDAILPGCRPVNVTINLKRDLKLQHATQQEGVVPCLQALNLKLPDAPELNMYWALPRQRYEAVLKEKAAMGVTLKGPDAVLAKYKRVVLFAVLVEFPAPRPMTYAELKPRQ